MEKEIVDLKIDFENLEIIYSNSTDCFRNQPVEKPCENCTVLKNQVKYLIKTCARFTSDEYHPTGLFSLSQWPGPFSFSLSLNK